MPPAIEDVWFRSDLPLIEIARRLGLEDVTEDSEDYWAWVIGRRGEAQLDITRTHKRPASEVDTRIFLLEGSRIFSATMVDQLVGRLRTFTSGPIKAGRWEYRSGNDFDLVVVQEFGEPGDQGAV